MVVQQEVSPPMSDRSPIWQHFYDCLEGRSNLTSEDSQYFCLNLIVHLSVNMS
jgi:hypothetical protein